MPDFHSYNPQGRSFYQVLTDAISDFSENGYDSLERVSFWLESLRKAAEASLIPMGVLTEHLTRVLRGAYHRLVEKAGILRFHPGVQRFTLQQVSPRLRAELDRRIMASANLIKINREEAISTTLRRFNGWATSIPPGGSEAVDKQDEKDSIRKPLRSLPYRERLVANDQGHKFAANLSEILATDTGAIAGIWHSHWKQRNYDYREDHKERDMRVFVVRGSWADDKGYLKHDDGYTDEITRPGEEVNCRCFYQWVTSLNRIPDSMLTAKGKEARDAARLAMAS